MTKSAPGEGEPTTAITEGERDGFELDEASTLELVEALAEAARGELFSEEEFWDHVKSSAKA